MRREDIPPVAVEVISAIRFLANQAENAALQAYWEDRDSEDDIYRILNDAIGYLNNLTVEARSTNASCPWGCGGRRCFPGC